MSSQGREAPRDHLSEELAFALQSLKDLEIERGAGDLEEADYQALKQRRPRGRSPRGRPPQCMPWSRSTGATTDRHRPRASRSPL